MDDQRRMAPHFLPGMAGMAGMAGMTAKREAKVGNLKLDLPVDEDDYLMPSPQPTQTNQRKLLLVHAETKVASGC